MTPSLRIYEKLLAIAKEVLALSREIETHPVLPLNKKQRKALDAVLRYLDSANEYKLGYSLRRAFGVELDNDRGKDDDY